MEQELIVPFTALDPKPQPCNIVKVDPALRKLFDNSFSYLVFKWQLFSQMIYSGMHVKYTPDVPIAATDSKSIFLHPAGFIDAEIDDEPQIAFVLAHEVGHRFLDDMVVMLWFQQIGMVDTLPYDHDLMNAAMDYRINAMLVSTGVGKMPKVGLYDPAISASGDESCVEIYKKLWKQGGGGKGPDGSPFGKGKSRPGGGGGLILPKGFDMHLQPSKDTVQADKGKREQEIVQAVQVTQRMQGTIPGCISRLVDDIIHPKTPWEDHLATTMTRRSGDPKLDWRYLNRRLAGRHPPQYFAKKGHKGAGTIALGADNSGSIGPHEVNVFASHMAYICEKLNPARLLVFWCDAAISREYDLDDAQDLEALFHDWRTDGVGGGGGTSFVPVFDRLNEMGVVPDMLVYFTDGYGTFPEEPRYPTIWASITDHTYPFGEVVRVEIDAAP